MSKELRDRIESEAVLAPPIGDDEAVEAAGEEAAGGGIPWPEPFPIPEDAGLEDYVRIAFERNPGIQARIRDVEALGMRVPQVTSLDDPTLLLVPPTGQLTETAAGQVDGAVGVTQPIPYPTKLRARGKVAEQVVRVALENLRTERIRVGADVKKSYYSFYFSWVALRITRESQDLLQHFRDVADARYRAGTAPQQDVLRAEVELYNLTNDIITLGQERDTARARLNILMDRDVTADLPEPPGFDPLAFGWKLDSLMARAVERSPVLSAAQERVGTSLEARRLARLQYLPNFSLGGLYTLISGGLSPVATGEDVWRLNLGLSLPIWIHRIRSGILQRNAEILAGALRYRSTRNDIFFAIQDLLVRLDAAYRSAVLFRDGILPRARQTVEVSESGYQAGELDFLTLIDNWRQLLDFRLEYRRELTSLEQNFAELEFLVGGDLSRAEEEVTP